MKNFLVFILLLTGIVFSASAQNIIDGEYFFDTDPGIGNGISIVIANPDDTVSQNLSINTSGLSIGPHVICIRVKNGLGNWSHTYSRSFYVIAPPTALPPITIAEYFFDSDPGLGNGISAIISSPDDTVTQNFSINISGLTVGPHIFCLRVKNNSDNWSHSFTKSFYVHEQTSIQPIIAAEYFYDTDPGLGNGISLSIPLGDTSNTTISLTNPFASGTHYIEIRTKDADGTWSHQLSDAFNVCATYGPKSIYDYVIDFNKVSFTNTSIYYTHNPGYGILVTAIRIRCSIVLHTHTINPVYIILNSLPITLAHPIH
jgi:hypothetical protein